MLFRSRGDNGQVFEAEGGENVYIMKKTASAEINALSALNEAHGGNSFGTSGLYKFDNFMLPACLTTRLASESPATIPPSANL